MITVPVVSSSDGKITFSVTVLENGGTGSLHGLLFNGYYGNVTWIYGNVFLERVNGRLKSFFEFVVTSNE